MVVVHPMLLGALVLPVLGAFLFAMQYDPMRLTGRLTRRLTGGLVLVGAWNLLLPMQHVAMNPLSISLSGWLGLPGTVLTALLALL